MSRSLGFALPLLLTLAACATPQQQCISAVAGNLQTLDGLILQTQGNLQRGFGYTQVVRNVPQFVPCGGGWNDSRYNNMDMCLVNTVQTFQQPVAIDLAAEQKKLDQLVARRAQLAPQVAPAIAACQAQYPQ
jgi:hypothetical protein